VLCLPLQIGLTVSVSLVLKNSVKMSKMQDTIELENVLTLSVKNTTSMLYSLSSQP
jgi:hypothetical protein